jgi:hypothetical protein
LCFGSFKETYKKASKNAGRTLWSAESNPRCKIKNFKLSFEKNILQYGALSYLSMSDSPIQVSQEVQTRAQEISAALADAVKNPPDLATYVRLHAESLTKFLSPVGFIYEMRQGNGLQRILVSGIETLEESTHPEQVQAFRKAALEVLGHGKPVMLPAQTQPLEPLHGLQTGDVPAAHRLPVFNLTDYTHFFIPIPLKGQVAGVIHAWFTAATSADGERDRAILIQRSAMDMELYLRARQVTEISDELVRLTSYARSIEELGGDVDLTSVTNKILQYAQNATGAGRVSLLVAQHYQQNLPRQGDPTLHFQYSLIDSIGQQPVMRKSEQAHVIESFSEYLLDQMARKHRELSEQPSEALSSDTKPGNALLMAPPGKRPVFEYVWIRRDQVSESDPQIVQDYLAKAPMNWATAMPLVDLHQRACGILLIEGREDSTEVAQRLQKLQSLAYSGGHALSTALFWEDRWALKAARKWIAWKDGTLSTPKKRLRTYIIAPLLALGIIMATPIPFNLKGIARVRPENVLQLVAEAPARITEICVHEGDYVQANDVLLRLDNHDLDFQMHRASNEYLQALSEADIAMARVDEVSMHAARLRARKAAAEMERIQYSLDKATVRAPFDAIILGPKNLAQKIGLVPGMGEPLVEIGSVKNWEVKISFSEQDMAMLTRYLEERGELNGSLRLFADPDKKYPLMLNSPSQLAYGLDLDEREYRFAAVVPLPLEIEENAHELVRAGFGGKASFFIGWRPIGYILLHDWIRAFKVTWL